jgi:hypothetical protein
VLNLKHKIQKDSPTCKQKPYHCTSKYLIIRPVFYKNLITAKTALFYPQKEAKNYRINPNTIPKHNRKNKTSFTPFPPPNFISPLTPEYNHNKNESGVIPDSFPTGSDIYFSKLENKVTFIRQLNYINLPHNIHCLMNFYMQKNLNRLKPS